MKNGRDIRVNVWQEGASRWNVDVVDTGSALAAALKQDCKATLYGLNFDFNEAARLWTQGVGDGKPAAPQRRQLREESARGIGVPKARTPSFQRKLESMLRIFAMREERHWVPTQNRRDDDLVYSAANVSCTGAESRRQSNARTLDTPSTA
jgi:hypothetical protein